MVVYTSDPSIPESEAGTVVYRVNSRTVRATKSNLVSGRKKKKTQGTCCS